MSKEELWEIFVKKNPQFLTHGANFSPAGVRKFFEQTFDQGYIEGRDRNTRTESNAVSDLASIFGMR